MFLKKIKIKGFKSFARTLVISFDSPITAIVGPNGSGKSNIVDAIRWALGEQSARTLRGNRMADVIFSGSEDYKPLHKASVTLYLDNSNHLLPLDTREVSICRQVDDSGQSDYLLNGNSCRLKDIEELLAGTGMGKDSYSVVGQGKIDSIINSKPEKLRDLFEEAAGITKHKQRKNEAEKRLEKTENDLKRIGDLVWELNKQAKPLEKAAEKARKYRRLKAELSQLEISFLLDRWEKSQGEVKKLQEEKELLSGKYSRIEEELAEVEENLQFTREGLRQEKELLEELKDNYYQQKGKKEEAENELKVLAERVRYLEEEKSRGEKRLQELHDAKKGYEKQLEELAEEKRQIGDLTEETTLRLQQTESLLGEKKMARKKWEQQLKSRQDLEYELDKYQGRGLLFAEEVDKIKKKQDILQAEKQEIIKKINGSEERQEELAGELKEIDLVLEELQEKEKTLKEQMEGLQEDRMDLADQLNRTRTQHQLLVEMEEDYRGYYPGVRAILKEGEKIPGIIGVVADLLNVGGKYELAIATALGANLQNLIVEDDHSARAGVEFLKKNKKGRATFLPLNMIRGRRLKLDRDIHEGLLGLAVEFVDYEKRLEPAVDYLLGDIVVARNLDDAVEISRKFKRSPKIVTLAGEFINSGGAITGGSDHKNKERLLSRSRQIKELAEKAQALEKRFSRSKEKINEIDNTIKKVQAAREEYKDNIHQRELDLKKWQEIKYAQQREQERLEKEINGLTEEISQLKEKISENDSSREEIKRQLTTAAEDSSAGDYINNLEDKIEELNNKLTELKIKQATLKQREESIGIQQENLSRKIAEISDNTDKTRINIRQNEEELLNLENKNKKLMQLRDDFDEEAKILAEVVEEKSQLLKQLEDENESLEKIVEEKRQLYNKFKDKLYGVELKLTRLEDRNEQLVERLREEYQLEPGTAEIERIDINFTGARDKIRELKSAIDRLGIVNQGADEEYETLKTRLEDLSQQHDDLTAARDSIRGVIKDLEERMALQFKETFQQVKEEFAGIFQRLFEGGQARLELTDPENMLETGVEIIAQPPGKQLKRLTLMSGGEKALTATALVFALLQVSPSPLYILDEIDAPLDDANVLRFSNFIKEYSKNVQFLLITHNKNMMVESDTIYGVTMEESGVSKLISIRLDQGIA